MHAIHSLRTLLEALPERLRSIPSGAAAIQADGGWSVKEELGHLVDSAANNHQRIVRAQLEDAPAMPDYDGKKWVTLHAYQKRDWHMLIEMWERLNQLLLAAAEAVPETGWWRTCTVGSSEPMTVQFLLEDYVSHMREHLRHMKVPFEDLT